MQIPALRLLRNAIVCTTIVSCTARDEGAPSTTSRSIARVSVPAITAADLDSVVARVVAEKKLPGLSIGVMQDGKVILDKGYGFRSLSPREPVTQTTMFPVGSVTKQFTCAAALLLQQDGKLSMRDAVAKYVPNATRANDITLADAGGHTTGYRDYYPLDFVDREMQKAESADTIIARYATRPLDFEPGTRYSYSNTNFLILGVAIERASGMSVRDFLTQRIFTPLGMTHSAYDPTPTDTGIAKGYTSYALAEPTYAKPEASGWTGAAGALYSTPADLLKWDLALMDGKVLSAASLAALTTPRMLADGRTTNYGCGMSINPTGAALTWSHGGAVAGSVTTNIMIPATRSAIVIFSNADFAATGDITAAAMAKLTPHIDVPKVAGLDALAAAKAFLESVERGNVDRKTLGDDFNALLTPEHLARDRASLAGHGKVGDVRVTRTVERGGMEVAVVQYNVGRTPAQSLMYRTPDGRIQQFLINRR